MGEFPQQRQELVGLPALRVVHVLEPGVVRFVDDHRIVLRVAGDERPAVPPQPVVGDEVVGGVPWLFRGWFLGPVWVQEHHPDTHPFQDGHLDVELVPELLLPLSPGASGSQDEQPAHLALVDAGLEQYSRLNGLAQANLVGDEKPVRSWSRCPLATEVLLVGPEFRRHCLCGGRWVISDGVPYPAPEPIPLVLG